MIGERVEIPEKVELETWINDLKYKIVLDIRDSVKESSLDKVAKEIKKMKSIKKKHYMIVLNELVDLKERYSKGDKSAEIRLRNYGFIRKKQNGDN